MSVPSIPYSSTRRKRPHGARRIFLNPRTGPGTRCDFGQNGQTNRVPCAFAIRSTMTDQPGLHSLYRTGSSGTTTAFFTIGRTSFVLLLLARFAVRFTARFLASVNFWSLLPALDNVLVSALVVSRLLPQCRERPRGPRMIALYLAFAAAVRMVDGIHSHAAHRRLDALPTRASCFSIGFILMIEVADLADRRHALHGKLANFAGRQLHERQVAFFAQQLRRAAGRTHHLAAAPRIEFQVVHHRAGRNVLELQRIARKNVRALAGRNRRAHFQSHRMQDVALVAIGVVQQREVRAAVWVVLDGRHFRGHAELFSPEVHLAVSLLVAAAAVPNHDFALVVAPAGAFLRLHQRLFRLLLGDVALVHDGDEPPRGRIWIKALQSHCCLLHSLCCFSLKVSRSYKFSAYSIIFSPSASFTYAFFQSRR